MKEPQAASAYAIRHNSEVARELRELRCFKIGMALFTGITFAISMSMFCSLKDAGVDISLDIVLFVCAIVVDCFATCTLTDCRITNPMQIRDW